MAMLAGTISDLSIVNIDDAAAVDRFNRSAEHNGDQINLLTVYQEPQCDIEEYDNARQQQWLIPPEYENFDIGQWLINQCQTPAELDRIKQELELFEQKQMFPVLRCLRYLIDVMRQHNIVWGVGRGSSVASYCLYLMGVHKIDSIKYSLDMNEFFKGELNVKKNT
jgi:DNA polymerase III alpha subunit